MEFKKINLEVRKSDPLQLHFVFKRNGQTYATLTFNFPNENERERVWSHLSQLRKVMGDIFNYKEW